VEVWARQVQVVVEGKVLLWVAKVERVKKLAAVKHGDYSHALSPSRSSRSGVVSSRVRQGEQTD
jgi:hypothetical protein